MKIGIIVAMQAELDRLLPIVSDMWQVKTDGRVIYTGRIGANEVAVMQCGIGKVNAAVGTMVLDNFFHPELIVNSGIAGGTGGAAGILDVMVADEVAYHDVWCGPGNERGQVQGMPARFSCREGLALLPALGEIAGLKHGLLASGDMFVDNRAELDRILSLYPEAIAVDMESGAIAQVCRLRDIPFAVIRVVSDYPGAPDHLDQYLNFWDDAPEATFKVLKTILS